MSDYRFSVLMSVYRKENEKHFRAAMESNLVSQSLKPDEMVLVCDGPITEELEQVICEYKNRFPQILHVFRLENNVGLGKALNYGLEHCEFTWVARSDSDDICAPDRFEKQIAYLKQNPDVDILSANIAEFAEDFTKPDRYKKMPTTHKDIVRMAKSRCPINHMAAIFRKTVIEECGSYQHLPYAEDYYLWVRAIARGAIFGNVNECLVFARVGNGMEKRRSNRAYIGSWKVLSQYMLTEKLIGRVRFLWNMVSIRVFVYMPVGFKKWVYKCLLRK